MPENPVPENPVPENPVTAENPETGEGINRVEQFSAEIADMALPGSAGSRDRALLWVGVVTSFGYALSMIPFVKRHEDQVMTFLMILPIFLLAAGLIGTVVVVIKKKYCSA